MARFRFWLLALCLGAVFPHPEAAQQSTRQAREEAADYYEKWLNEDVVYIIAPEERDVFRSLTTPEEREQFIEQFWFRRDPDPRTGDNEYRAEHYRRIAYANERFASGFPGWMTDRGRIYILHGSPTEIETYPSGGTYTRPFSEGGGQTSTFPFEIWRYRHIEGVGDDIILEFVDRTHSGEYRLALRPEEKDALLFIPGGGLTWAEEMGLADKRDRAFFNPANPADPLTPTLVRDNPFLRYEVLSQMQRPVPVKYNDLKELVNVSILYAELPFQVREDYFRLSGEQVLTPVTLQISNRSLAFQRSGDLHVARVAVYGIVTSLQGRIVDEFEHDLVAAFAAEGLVEGLARESVYQKLLLLRGRQRYRLDLVVKDLHSGQVGVTRRALIPPAIEADQTLRNSSVILAESIRFLEGLPQADEIFLIGDVKVMPNLSRVYSAEKPLELYFHVYNAAVDQSTLQPSLNVVYKLLREGEPVRMAIDSGGQSIQYASPDRIVLVRRLSVEALEPGPYQVLIEIEDLISGRRLEIREPFDVRAEG